MQETEWLFGRNAVHESLVAGRRTFYCLQIAEGSKHHPRIQSTVRLATERNVDVAVVPRSTMDGTVSGNHQGVLLSASPYPYVDWLDLKRLHANRRIILVLDGLQDPKNVGTLLRTAEAIEVGGVVIPADRAVGITPAVVNASAGATEHLDILRETNLVRWLKLSQDSHYWVTGLAADPAAENLFDIEVPAPTVLVVGAEGGGLRRLVQATCDLLVSLPMYGQISSLNAAVAGSIALYEIREYN